MSKCNFQHFDLAAFLRGLSLLAAAIFGLAFIALAAARLVYPYDLDFIEDGILMGAFRVASRQSVYVPPNADFVPHVYMPLFSWLGGGLLALFGGGYVPLRGLSVAATASTAGLVFWLVRRESGQVWLGLVCAGLFLGGYRISGFEYDLARVDSLAVALTVGGLAADTAARNSRWGLVAAGVLLALAFLSKQTALFFGVALGLYLTLTIGRRAWQVGLPFLLLTVGPVLALQFYSDGWFLFTTFTIAGINPVEWQRVVHFATVDLFGLMGGLAVMALGAAALVWRRAGWRGIARQPWFWWLLLGVAVSGLGRASVGGNINNRMMGYALLCLSPGLLWRAWPDSLPRGGNRRIVVISALILLQFGLGAYNPWRYFPSAKMRRSGDRLVESLADAPGEVLVLMHPYYAQLAGKPPSAQIAAMWHARERGSLPLPSDFAARIEQRHYALVVSDESLFETEPALRELLERTYIRAGDVPSELSPPTMSGLVVRPRVWFTPAPTATQPAP